MGRLHDPVDFLVCGDSGVIMQFAKVAAPDPGTEKKNGAEPAWAVVNTHPHKELYALSNLEKQGFHVYCPMLKKRIKHARAVKDVLRPIFQGYVFVQVERNFSGWRPICSTAGVRALVRCGDRPGFIDHKFVLALRAKENSGALIEPCNVYRPGEEVRLEGGVFDGLVATIVEMAERDRVVVLMNILNRAVKTTVEVHNLVPSCA